MHSFVCAVASYVVNAAWEVPLLAGAGWIAAWLLRGWGPRTAYRLWVGVLLLSVVMPAMPVLGELVQAAMESRGGGVAAARLLPAGAGLHAAGGTAGWVLPAWELWGICGVFLSVGAYRLSRLLWLLAGARELIGASERVVLNEEAARWWEGVRSKFAVGEVGILCSASSPGIVTVGARRAAIVVPPGFLEECEEDDFASAMGHELAHVERRDYAKNLLLEGVSAVVGFHPVTWIVKAQIVSEREMICDAMAAERLMGSKVYRRSLLRLAARMVHEPAVGVPGVGIFDGNRLERRMMALKTTRRVPGAFARTGWTGCVVVLLAAVLATGNVLAKPVTGSVGNHPAKVGKIYVITKGVTPPVALFTPEPRFPKREMAKKGKRAVSCDVSVVIDRSGRPRDLHVVRSAGKDFDASALRSLRQYKFKPAMLKGKPVAVRMVIEVLFRKY